MVRPRHHAPLSLHIQSKRFLRTYHPDAPDHPFATVSCSREFILFTSSRTGDVIVHRRSATAHGRWMGHKPRFVKEEQGDI